jgi:hypothetical protein
VILSQLIRSQVLVRGAGLTSCPRPRTPFSPVRLNAECYGLRIAQCLPFAADSDACAQRLKRTV